MSLTFFDKKATDALYIHILSIMVTYMIRTTYNQFFYHIISDVNNLSFTNVNLIHLKSGLIFILFKSKKGSTK